MVGRATLGRRVLTVYVPLALFLVFLLFPFYWMFIVSMKRPTDLFNLHFNPFGIQHFTLGNYGYLFRDTEFATWAKNTLIVSTAATLLSLACSVLIGYALARLRFRGGGDGRGGDLPRLSRTADAPLPAARGGRCEAAPLQHLLGVDFDLPNVPHSVRVVAVDGIFSDDSRARSRNAR